MSKFFVIVNQKYVVSVEAQTSGGAEHVILDLLPLDNTLCKFGGGITSCQAFSERDMKTECFVEMVKDCNTVSLSEFVNMCETFKKHVKEFNSYLDEVIAVNKKISHLEDEINLYKQDLCSLQKNILCSRDAYLSIFGNSAVEL